MNSRSDARAKERHVICVDGDREFLESLDTFLPEQVASLFPDGPVFKFAFFYEPIEALERLRWLTEASEIVALLLCDQQMSPISGTEFLAQARELAPDSMRALFTRSSGIDAAILGVDAQLLHKRITKPIESELDLVLSLKQLLGHFELNHELKRQTALLRGLYGFANDLNATTGVDAAMRLAVEFTKAALPCNEARVILAPHEERDETQDQGPELAIVPEGAEPSPAPSVQTGIVARAEDCPWYEGMGYVAEGAWAPGPVAYAVLEAGTTVVGLLLAWEPAGGPLFGEETLESLRYIAASASIAIESRLSRTRLEDIARTRAQSLEDASARLEILDRLKTDFLSFVSHELRTPLNHMSAIGMLEDEMMDPQDRVKMVAVVRNGYERLERFIMSSLEYFEWFSARREPCQEVTNMTELVEARVAKSRVHDTVPIEWNLRLSREPCLALFPRAAAEKLLSVLIDNAVKFANGTPAIRIGLSVRGGWVTLVIADRGRGFPPEWASEIFRPFTIADPLHHREGTALSLAKAAAMVEAYGGRIRAESPGPDQGAVFSVDLPIKTETRSRLVEVKDWRSAPPRDGAARQRARADERPQERPKAA